MFYVDKLHTCNKMAVFSIIDMTNYFISNPYAKNVGGNHLMYGRQNKGDKIFVHFLLCTASKTKLSIRCTVVTEQLKNLKQ